MSNTSTSSEDGILTADEILDIDMPSTQVVVLSMCESGLGNLIEGEGVFGLRRAFAMAGAHTVISSLWKISDSETAELFRSLYPFVELSAAESLVALQRGKINNLRRMQLPPHPYLWASFIATGGR